MTEPSVRTGTGVPDDFRLPWNTTVSMADVWAENIAAQRKAWREQKYRKRARRASHDVRIRYAGFDGAEA